MKRIGIWLLIAAVCFACVRIYTDKDANRASMTIRLYKGFVYRAPWNGPNQLTLLGDSFHAVLYTQGYRAALIRRLEKGCYVEFERILFTSPKVNRNPGVFNYRNYLLSRGITYTAQADESHIRVQSDLPFQYWIRVPGARFRSMSYDCLEDTLGKEIGSMVQGVMTGDTGAMEDTDAQAFRASGLSHLMAVSGTHVAFVLAPFKKMLRNRYCSYRVRNLLLLIPLFIFWILTDGTPSVTRACVSCAGLLVARVLGKPPDGCNFLMLSAGFQILINPYILYNAGFLMSYGASVGIYFVLPFIQDRFTFFDYEKEPVRSIRIINRKTLLAGISVNIVLCPLMLYLFGTYSLCGVFLTLYASFPAGMLCAGGYLLCILSFLLGKGLLTSILAGFLTIIGKFLQGLANIGSILPAPLGQIQIPGIPLWLIVSLFVFLLFLLLYRKRIFLCILIFSFITVCTFGIKYMLNPALSFLFVDVGQGACVLVKADGYYGLIDTGDGKTDLIDVLHGQSVARLDFVVLTHGHQDHIGGLEQVLDACAPTVLYTSGNGETGLQEAIRSAENHDVSVHTVNYRDQIQLGCVTMEFIVSDAFFGKESESMENNASLNVRFACDYGSALVCGDLEAEGIEQLLQVCAFQKTDVLFVPHHGSNSGTSEKMLSNILPKYAIISVGVKNSYGHPGEQTLFRLECIGAWVYRTDIDGGISVTIGSPNWFRKKCVEVCRTLL